MQCLCCDSDCWINLKIFFSFYSHCFHCSVRVTYRLDNRLSTLIFIKCRKKPLRSLQRLCTLSLQHSFFLTTHSFGRVVPGRSAAHRDAFGDQQTRTGRRSRSRFLPLGFVGGACSPFLGSCLHFRLRSYHRRLPGSHLLRQFGSDGHRCFDIPVNILCPFSLMGKWDFTC